MKDIRALDVKVFDTRKYTTPQKAFEEQAYFEGLLWIYTFVAFYLRLLSQQILKDIHHNDAIVEGVGGDIISSQYYLGECIIGEGE